MNEISLFRRCGISLEEKVCVFLLESLGVENPQVPVKGSGKPNGCVNVELGVVMQKRRETNHLLNATVRMLIRRNALSQKKYANAFNVNANMLTCSGCVRETKISSKEPDLPMDKKGSAVTEQNLELEDLIEYVAEEEQYLSSIESEDFNSKVAAPNRDDISINHELASYRRGSGRPPKRYDTLFQCDLCCYATAYAKYFRAHMSEAHQEEQARIFKCPHCIEAYVEARYLREHIKYKHERMPRKPKLICAECGKGFPKQSHLRRHSYVHNPNQKPFLCEYCPMRFASQSTLTRHIDGAHKKTKPHVCELCGKAFGHIYGLKAHKQNVHLKEAQ